MIPINKPKDVCEIQHIDSIIYMDKKCEGITKKNLKRSTVIMVFFCYMPKVQ